MTEGAYSTPTNTDNPIMNPRVYWKVSAVALWAVAALGIALTALDNADMLGANFLTFDWTHNVLHVVLAAAATFFGFGPVSGTMMKTTAIVFGVVYAGLGVLGFITDEVGPIGLELGENLVHLVLGAWALLVGITAKY